MDKTGKRNARFGWQGFEVSVPPGWDLGAYRGDFDAGYACLDDGMHVRLQLRWSRARRRAEDLDRLVVRYERALRKASKVSLAFERESVSFLPRRVRDQRDVAVLQWKGGQQTGYGLVWRCRVCARVGALQILFAPDGIDLRLARRILASVEDHRDDGSRLWSAYGFAFECPASYNLERTGFAPGRLQYAMRAGRRSWLRVERWAVASQWLGGVELDALPGELLMHLRLAGRSAVDQAVATTVNGHAGCAFEAVARRRGLFRSERVGGIVWRCPVEDKMFAVLAAGAEAGLPESIAATIECA